MKLPVGKLLQNGKYRVEKVLGQGSYGITYLASVNLVGNLGVIRTEAKVAIKELFINKINGRNGDYVTASGREVFSNFKDRFIKEARALSRLNHPHIVHVLELFEENNTAYYVMEYLEGGSLEEFIVDKKRLSQEEAVNYIRQIAEALEYMHANGMLHLDLKPANIVLSSSGEPVIIDFGLTKVLDPESDRYSTTIVGYGTPGYAPLEQYNYQRGKMFSVTMDVYALGATFYKMLFGKRPPDAVDLFNEGVRKLNLHMLNDELLQSIIAKAMEPKKGLRYQTVRDFIDSLPTFNNSFKNPISDENIQLKVEIIEDTNEVSFPQDTISICLLFEDNAVVFYFRGTVYADFSGEFLSNFYNEYSFDKLNRSFERYFKKYETISFDKFMDYFRNEIEFPGQFNYWWRSYPSRVFVSYLWEDDYFKVMSAFTENKIHSTDITRENHFIASYICREKSDVNFDEHIHKLIYENTELGFEYEDGVCELGRPLDFDELKSWDKLGETFIVSSLKQLKIQLFGGILSKYDILTGRDKAFLLLDIFPFDIGFGPKWGDNVPQMIFAGYTVPTRKSEIFDLVGTDVMSVRIGEREYTFKPGKDFGYLPKYIECTIEIDSKKKIQFTIKDKDNGKEVKYNHEDFVSQMEKIGQYNVGG